MYQIVCRKCQQSFESAKPKKQVCSDCIRKRNREIKKRWYYSEKGKVFYHKRLEAMRKNPKREGHPACIDCGKRLPRYKTTRCKSCHWKYARGENHPWWKGGKVRQYGGYIRVRAPNHPRANPHGYVLEHHLVWEQANGRYLPDGWLVHHLNGMKSDNRPANLVALPSKKHYLVLAAKAKRIQELEAMLNNQHQLL